MAKMDDYNDAYMDDLNEEQVSSFSVHPVNWSYELSDDTLLGKSDMHFEELLNHFNKLIDEKFERLKARGKV